MHISILDDYFDTLRTLPSVNATYFFSKPVNATSLLEKLRHCLA